MKKEIEGLGPPSAGTTDSDRTFVESAPMSEEEVKRHSDEDYAAILAEEMADRCHVEGQ